MKQPTALLFAVAASLALGLNGWADVITFDDINTGGTFVSIPNGYAGLNWNNFDAHSGSNIPLSGYTAGLVSPPNDAFNAGGVPASFSSNTEFSFVSGYFTGAWNDGLNITIQGLNGANVLDSTTIIVSSTGPTLETFNWTGLTQVTLDSFGGTPDPTYAPYGSGTHFVLDNLTINAVPEPATGTMVVIALLGIVSLRSRVAVTALRKSAQRLVSRRASRQTHRHSAARASPALCRSRAAVTDAASVF